MYRMLCLLSGNDELEEIMPLFVTLKSQCYIYKCFEQLHVQVMPARPLCLSRQISITVQHVCPECLLPDKRSNGFPWDL